MYKELILLCVASRISLQLKNYEWYIVEKKGNATVLRVLNFFRHFSRKFLPLRAVWVHDKQKFFVTKNYLLSTKE